MPDAALAVTDKHFVSDTKHNCHMPNFHKGMANSASIGIIGLTTPFV